MFQKYLPQREHADTHRFYLVKYAVTWRDWFETAAALAQSNLSIPLWPLTLTRHFFSFSYHSLCTIEMTVCKNTSRFWNTHIDTPRIHAIYHLSSSLWWSVWSKTYHNKGQQSTTKHSLHRRVWRCFLWEFNGPIKKWSVRMSVTMYQHAIPVLSETHTACTATLTPATRQWRWHWETKCKAPVSHMTL